MSQRVLLLDSEFQPKHGDGFVTVTLKQFVDCMNEFLGAYDNARLLPTGIVDSLKNAAGRNMVLQMRSNGLLRDVLGLDDRRKNKIRGINLSDQHYATNAADSLILYLFALPESCITFAFLFYFNAAETVPRALEKAARAI